MSASRGFLGHKKGIQYGPRITAGRFSETSKTGGSEQPSRVEARALALARGFYG